jgi:hypothetical protein
VSTATSDLDKVGHQRVVADLVDAERQRQRLQWEVSLGEPDHDLSHTPAQWTAILGKLHGDLCTQVLYCEWDDQDAWPGDLVYAAVQLAATASAMAEALLARRPDLTMDMHAAHWKVGTEPEAEASDE